MGQPSLLSHFNTSKLPFKAAQEHASSLQGAALAPEPLQYLKVTVQSCTFACFCIPRAALAPEPPQYLQVITLSCISACFCIPRATLAPEPSQYLQVATFAGTGKEFSIHPEPLLVF